VVVVGAAVVAVVVAEAAVGLGESPPHPPASSVSRVSRVRVASRMAKRPVLDGIGPSDAASRRASPLLAWTLHLAMPVGKRRSAVDGA
jgi:hypothetical protein